MKLRIAVAVVAAAAATFVACTRDTFVIHTKSSPKRVDRKVVPEPTRTVFSARRRAPDRVEIRVGRRGPVSIERTVVYGSSLTRGVGGSALWEIVEFPLGLIGFWTFFMDMGSAMDRDNVKSEWTHRSFFITFLDPTTRMMSIDFVTARESDDTEFRSDTETTHLYAQAPAQGTRVRYRVLDDRRQVLLEGSGTADAFGAVAVDGITEAAVAIEVSDGDTKWYLPIPPMPDGMAAETPDAAVPPPLDAGPP